MGPGGSAAVNLDQPHDRRRFLTLAKRVMRHVPFIREVIAMYFATLDRHTPMWVKATIVGAIAYFVLPFDAIPDVLVGLGFTDDAAVVLATYKAVAAHVTDDHKQRAQDWMDKNT